MSRSFGGTSFTTRSPIAIVPSLIRSRPATIRSAVDFPHPDGPTRIRNSPSATSRVRSSTATTGPGYTFVTPSNATRAIALALQSLGGDAAHEVSLGEQEEHDHRQHRHDVGGRAEGIDGSFVWTHGENRSSLSVADRSAGNLTEFYEHGPDAPEAAWAELLEAVNGLVLPGDWLTISGSMPRGPRDEGDRDRVAEVMDAGLRVALDAEGEPLRLAVEAGPEIVKLNASEASGLDRERQRL